MQPAIIGFHNTPGRVMMLRVEKRVSSNSEGIEMTTNFQIEEFCSVVYKGVHIDLHNNFDLTGYTYDIATRQMTLKWTKSTGDWVKENEYENLWFIHSNVTYLNISYDNKAYEFPHDDSGLSDLTFYPSEYRDENEWLLLQEEPNAGDDIIYLFQSEHFIRIGCDTIELVTH